MPADPIEYRIVLSLQDALKTISIAGGYHFDVLSTAVKLDPNQDVEALIAPGGPRPFIVIDVPTLSPPEYFPAEQLRRVMPITIHWVSDSTPTDDTSRMKTFFRGCADVERAIAIDVTRGGLAVDTRLGEQRFDTAIDGAQVWAQIDTEITVYRTYGLPNG